MAHTVNDAAGKPVAALLDAEECRWIASALAQYLTAEQARQHKPSLTYPPPVLRALAALEPVSARWRPTADGHFDDAATCETSANGSGEVVVDQHADTLDTRDLANLLGITTRQARRRCEQIGRKVGGRWIVHRADLETK